jgi:hypothetical protein
VPRSSAVIVAARFLSQFVRDAGKSVVPAASRLMGTSAAEASAVIMVLRVMVVSPVLWVLV